MSRRLLVTLLFFPLASTFAELREWTDTQGRTMTAELLARADGEVTIRREDGQIFSVSLDLFSDTDRKYAYEWSPPELPVPTINEAVFIIKTPDGSGSGFLMQDMGQVFLYTNQHVIQGYSAADIKATNADGDQARLGDLQIIPDADIARIRVDSSAGLKLATEAAMNQAIQTIGNSDGAGVLTVNKGEIIGLGSDLVEVTAEIIPGNSGGPILDENNQVIGLATYISTKGKEESEDWKIKDTRYSGTRRFGLRILSGMNWQPVEWDTYAAQGGQTQIIRDEIDRWFEMHKAILRDPSVYLQVEDEDSRFLRTVAEEQNAQARRFDAKIGNTVNRAELDRVNRYENRKLGERMEENLEALERYLRSFRSTNKDIHVPFFVEQIEEAESWIEGLRKWVKTEMDQSRQFFRYR